MRLTQFRVQNFRSIEDSGWITCDDVTTLVGMNEAGKSNILLALWKLKPAKGGDINLLSDMPRRIYSQKRNKSGEIVFIEADFELELELHKSIVEKALLKNNLEERLILRASRKFDGKIEYEYLNAKLPNTLLVPSIFRSLQKAKTEIIAIEVSDESVEFQKKNLTLSAIESYLIDFPDEKINSDHAKISALRQAIIDLKTKISGSQCEVAIKSLYSVVDQIDNYFCGVPYSQKALHETAINAIPTFVYYSNYGNLDSEIYLPHVIENFTRKDLSSVAEAKARTVRVLFEFVGLDPNEIMTMGKEPVRRIDQYNQVLEEITEEKIRLAAAQKTERQALLHSAQGRLSREFKNWWKQGDYTFDFQADGNHFRIWVSDTLRPDPIELENRSTGLQWFLSFFLVFLVESQDAHANSVLLLDEAGHSLHPLAQRDLAVFFANLSGSHQIIHTTQSPFLVDTNHVDRVKVVYVDKNGFTIVSENLRANQGLDTQQRSVYAVHAALGLSISDMLLQGCLPVIVEGVSDQFYLSAIKNKLIGDKLISPTQEIIFVPSGGTRGIKPLSSLLAAKENELPVIILDGDKAGLDTKTNLEQDLYKFQKNDIITIDKIVGKADAEVEDLIPIEWFESSLNRLFRDVESEIFSDIYDSSKPIIDEIERFAGKHGISLENGWKVNLAKQFKQRLQTKATIALDKDLARVWKSLFQKILK